MGKMVGLAVERKFLANAAAGEKAEPGDEHAVTMAEGASDARGQTKRGRKKGVTMNAGKAETPPSHDG